MLLFGSYSRKSKKSGVGVREAIDDYNIDFEFYSDLEGILRSGLAPIKVYL
jgi:hypothetical protein